MILLEEGFTIVYKIEINSTHFLPQGRNNLNKEELENLKNFIEKHRIEKSVGYDKIVRDIRDRF